MHMSEAVKAICGVLLSGALLFGCHDESRPGCTNDNRTLFDQPCFTSNQCPECDPVCASEGGTSLGGPACVLIIGFGYYCVCGCEVCNDAGTGGTGGGAGGTGGGTGGTGDTGGTGGGTGGTGGTGGATGGTGGASTQ